MSFCTRPIVAAKKRRRRADTVTNVSAIGASLEQRRQAADHETPAVTMVAAWISADTGVGPFHRVGQPGVQQELRRLAHRAHEQQQADDGQRVESHAEEAERRPHARRAAKIVVEATTVSNKKAPKMPRQKPKSPTRLTTNALIAAALADGF